MAVDANTMQRGVFLDRDGVICTEEGYLSDSRRLQLIPGSADAVKLFNLSGLKVVVVSNQSGVARGFFSEAQVTHLHQVMCKALAAEGARLDGIYYCPHHPGGSVAAYRRRCDCRKPATGLLIRAARERGIDLARSFLVGDKLSDIECAYRARVKGILVLTGYGAEECARSDRTTETQPAFIAKDLLEAARWILDDIRSSHDEGIGSQTQRHR